jgi:hypothetical protein
MEENKYYTPEIYEFHDGFEYEYNEYNEEEDEFTGRWISTKFDSRCGLGHDQNHFLSDGQIRVKYLDKEDIEAEGFTYKKHKISEDFWKGDKQDNTLIEVLPDKTLCIRRRKNGMLESEIISITIKNKFELKRVLKMIKV